MKKFNDDVVLAIIIELVVATLFMWVPAGLSLLDFHGQPVASCVQYLSMIISTIVCLVVYVDAGSRMSDVFETTEDDG
jgi:hypothetical protein